uniref:Uncharacterized protein n=1 Tax=Meloidogyne enterolobii TaxID=390850 RepID=A0A6V7TW51_MELEN|nr:unnamed protein product [Meloidogyne enterolobii]
MASVEISADTEAPNTSRAREIGIGLCYEPRPSARRLPARRVPQNPARSAGFCTSASPTPHRFMLLVFCVVTLSKLVQSR